MTTPTNGAVRTTGRRRTRAALVIGAPLVMTVALFGAGIAARGTGELHVPAPGTTTVLRAAVFAALALHLGELAGARLAGAGRAPRSWALWAALGGAAASAGQIVLLAEVSDLDLTATYGTRDGGLLLAMANGFALAAGCVVLGRPGWAAGPLALVIGAEAMRAHPEPYTPEWGTALTVVHLTAASLWVGGLWYVLRTMWLRGGGRDVLARYARLAGWLYAALAVTGTCSTLRRLPAEVVFTTAYGRVLIVKLVLVAVASALAVSARRRLRRGGDATAPARTELAVLAGVVLVSAVLTVVPDPHWLSVHSALLR
ncbi:copper resistance protein CopD [Streptomyces sp. CB03234]|uniref:CopD family protein n=1 Tax=Streptomyces sp. (strain CB03234) TaxID=1703937 RepID=UPI00093C57D1|nr:CopD family protein [Streptomyces sp. CB03234]OKK06647.1 copper resistance protein CopD [Streptomyces sp. CB03234]